MCGIFAVVGARCAGSEILGGLQRLQYRGYDSWGLGVRRARRLETIHQLGPIDVEVSCERLANARVGLGHTRWATNGEVSQRNAHPIVSSSQRFILVHNGIIENCDVLRQSLTEQGRALETETDTEVAVALIEQELNRFANPTNEQKREALKNVLARLRGRNTFALLFEDSEEILGVRNGSPLVVGVGDRTLYLASDPLSFAHQTNRVVTLRDGELVHLSSSGIRLFNLEDSFERGPDVEVLDVTAVEATPEPFAHFMLKEIMAQPGLVRSALPAVDDDYRGLPYRGFPHHGFLRRVRRAERVFVCGSGGAFFAAAQAAHYLRTISALQAVAVPACEFQSYEPLVKPGDVFLALSQSGETVDTIDALECAQANGAIIASVVNMPGASISRMSQYSFMNNVGPEICVLSTKSAFAQLLFGYYLAVSLNGWEQLLERECNELERSLTEYCSQSLSHQAREIAEALVGQEHLYILGKGANYHIAQIAALNIKEASYIHAESFSAGELKHGVLALIEAGSVVVVYVDEERDRDAMMTAVHEVRARGAVVLGIARVNREQFNYFLPFPNGELGSLRSAAHIIPGQLLAYHLALVHGHNPDRPRNLAKSITVR